MAINTRSHFLKPFGPWHFLVGVTPRGKGVRWGPYNSEADAMQSAQQARLQNVQVFPVNTRDIDKAASLIRGKMMERGADIDDTLRRRQRTASNLDDARPAGFRRPNILQESGKNGIIRSNKLTFDEGEA